MKRILLILVLFPPAFAFCQKMTYSVRAGANYPIIADVSRKPTLTAVSIPTSSGYFSATTNVGTITETFSESVGAYVGGNVNRSIGKRLFITTGLSFEYRKFNRSEIIDNDEEFVMPIAFVNVMTGQPYGTIQGTVLMRDANGNLIVSDKGQIIAAPQPSDKLGDTQILMIEAPLAAGTHFFKRKLVIQLGANFGYLIDAYEYQRSYAYPYGFEVEKTKNLSDFNRFTIGLNLSTSYMITSRIGISVSALRNLSPIYTTSSEIAGPAYLNSFSAGTTYLLTR
jgi:hypothetical protein